MRNSFPEVVLQLLTATIIVIATRSFTRWLMFVAGNQLPRIRGDTRIYAIRSQMRATGVVAAILCLLLAIWLWYDPSSRELSLIPLPVVALVIWFAAGVVKTDGQGITKRVLWHSCRFRWDEITAVRVLRRQGGAIDLRTGERKLVVDSRFNAMSYLLEEIKQRTKLEPVVS